MTDTNVNEIDVRYPTADDLHLRLSAGACRFNIRPGAGEAWVSGTYRDPSGRRSPRIEQDGGTIRIVESDNPLDGMTSFLTGIPQYNLAIGKERPFALTVETGASDFIADLGGLPITRLEIKQGAGRFEVDFSAPNPEPMSTLNMGSGAGGMFLKNLANANFAEMRIEGGAASYRFDFAGDLRRDGQVRITTAVSAVEIVVPTTTAVKVNSEAMLGAFHVGDGFMKKEGAFWNQAALEGKTPVLTIRTNVALGALNLRLS